MNKNNCAFNFKRKDCGYPKNFLSCNKCVYNGIDMRQAVNFETNQGIESSMEINAVNFEGLA